jgi:hypothetical protein
MAWRTISMKGVLGFGFRFDPEGSFTTVETRFSAAVTNPGR